MAGSRIIFQILAFTFFVNMMIGLTGQILPEIYGTSEFTNGLVYNTNTTQNIANAQGELTPASQITNGGGFFSSILDAITAGYFTKMINFINENFLGLVGLLKAYFGPFMNPTLSDFLFNLVLTPILSLMYIFGIIWLFTGRNLTRESL